MIRSLFKKHHKFSFFRAVTVMTALGSLLSAGCMGDDEVTEKLADGDGDQAPQSWSSDGQREYSVKVYVRNKGDSEFHLVEVPAWDSAVGRKRTTELADYLAEGPDSAGKGNQYSSSQTQGPSRNKKQAFNYQTNVPPPTWAEGTPWYLAFLAARSCRDELEGSYYTPIPIPVGEAGISIWQYIDQSEYPVLLNPPLTCDAHLVQQQNMLCTAAKLAELADAVGPIEWSQPSTDVIIPAQDPRDRFILRDQALTILDQLSRLVDKPPTAYLQAEIHPLLDGSCAEQYAELLAASSSERASILDALTSSHPMGLVGGALLGQMDVDLPFDYFRANLDLAQFPIEPGTVEDLVLPRMRLQAHIARASFRLMRELVEEGLKDDLAGAEAHSALSLSQAWAVDPSANLEGYDSYRHGVRTVLGAWQSWPAGSDRAGDYVGEVADPACNGYGNLRYRDEDDGQISDDLVDPLQMELESSLKAPKTSGQSVAWRLFASTGLVVHRYAESPVDAIRAALGAVALAQAAMRAGVSIQSELDAFAESTVGSTLSAELEQLSDQDILYGAARAVRVYSLLVGERAEILGADEFLPGASVASPWSGSEDALVQAVGGFVVPDGLPERDLNASLFGAFGNVGESCGPARRIATDMRVFRGELRKLGSVEELQELVAPALVEVGQAVSIEGHLVDVSLTGPEDQVTIQFRVERLFPDATDWLGVRSGNDLAKRLVLVQGSRADAECAAGLRDRCVGDSSARILSPTNGASVLVFGYVYTVSRTYNRYQNDDSPVWLVLRGEGADPGAIIGFGGSIVGGSNLILTDWEQSLLESVRTGRAVEGPSCERTYDPRTFAYCVDGVERDMFVPVANALTGEGGDVDDSWRHYLTLAKDSAAKADQLGTQLIELGTSRDLRREGAQQAIAAMCGGFPEEADLVDEDNQASLCLNEETYDVVYFASLESADGTEKARADLKTTICPSGSENDSDLCARVWGQGSGSDPSRLSVESLNFSTVVPDDDPTAGWDSSHCSTAYSDVANILDGASSYREEKYRAYINGGDISSATMMRAANRLTLEVDINGTDWVLRRGGAAVLGWVNWQGADTTEDGRPAPGLFAAYPGCMNLPSLNCSASDPEGCCDERAKAVIGLLDPDGSSGWTQEAWRTSLESGLWSVGYAAGAFPKGMFTVPVPVAAWGPGLVMSGPPGAFSPAAYFGQLPFADQRTVPHLNGVESPNVDTFSNPRGHLFAKEFGTGLSAGRMENKTYSSWFANAQPGYRYVTLGTSPELRFSVGPQFLDLSESNFSWQEQVEQYAFRDFGSINGLFSWDSGEPLAQQACLRDPSILLDGNVVLGDPVLVDRSRCSSETEETFGGTFNQRPVSDVLPLVVPRWAGWDLLWFSGYDFAVSCKANLGSWVDPTCYLADAPWETASGLFALPETDVCEGIYSVCDDRYCKYKYRASGPMSVLQECGPNDRVVLAINREKPPEQRVPMAAMLDCLAAESRKLSVGEPPAVRSSADVEMLRNWLRGQAEAIGLLQKGLFAVETPKATVEYHQQGFVPSGVVGSGDRGEQILRIATALESVDRGFRAVRGGVDHMASALGGAESQFEAVEIAGEKELLQVALQRVEASRQVAQAAITIAKGLAQSSNVLGTIFSGGQSIGDGVANVASGAVDAQAAVEKLSLLKESDKLAALSQVNATSQVIIDLNSALLDGVREIEEGITQVSEARLSMAVELNKIKSRESAASVQFSMMTGEDFADLDGDGEPDVALPVNTVYRRQYEVLRQRYDRALATAKRYAYYTRLAIEQRLGVRLDTLDDPVGPLPAPSSWIEGLCAMTGIDYQALRTACASGDTSCIDGGSNLDDKDIVFSFADQYIGDYVSRLEELIENYNIMYPFQDSEDVAVVSVRDHVLNAEACPSSGRNLLASSSDLTQTTKWSNTGCSVDSCVRAVEAVLPGTAQGLSGDTPLPPPEIPGGATLVSSFPRTTVQDSQGREVPVQYRAGFVQPVQLQAGISYELSWWDSSRTSAGAEGTEEIAYRALVTNESWEPFVVENYSSYVPAGVAPWSERRIVQFTVPLSGEYHVGLQMLEEGHVAFANLQLADLSTVLGSGAPYRDTNVDGVNRCDVVSSLAFSDHFERACDDLGCFFELRDDISLDELDILSAGFSQSGIPAANYNYRHAGVALNAVGTGLMNCDSQNQSCFANGFLEYDLEHSAFQSRITNYGGEQQCFSFGEGAIRRGKALAAERVLGVPMSSTDKELISGEEFMKPVLKGRPLDGTYRLRIYDREGFNIEQLEDVQLVLKHVYWSRVERTPN